MSAEMRLLLSGVKPEMIRRVREFFDADSKNAYVISVCAFPDLENKLGEPFDIIVFDGDAAPQTDVQAIEKIKRASNDASLILTAGRLDKARIHQAMQAGVSDIVEKENPERILPVIKREADNIRLQRKQIEAYYKVLESEARYRAIFERTGTAKCLFTSDGIIQLANSQFMKLTGLESADRKAEIKWIDLILKEDRPKFAAISELIHSGKIYLPWKEEFRMVDNRGKIKFLIGTFSVIPETGEHILSMVDITSLKLMQTKLRQSEKRLAEAQKMAHLGNWEWDIQSDRLNWSDEIFRITEVDSENFIPSLNSFFNLVHPQDRRKVRRAIRNSLVQRKPYSIEHRIETHKGKVKILHEMGDVIRNRQGRPVRMVGTVQDISQRSQMEKYLRKTHKMEALGTLAGGISHDLNNILMPIVLNTELALWQIPDDSPVKDYLKQVLAAAKRGKELVNQVVSFSRQKPDEMKVIHLIPLIKEAMRLIRASAPAGIDIQTRYHTENDKVYGNPTQIHQVLMNLCSNAVQAFDDERGRMEVVLESIRLDENIKKRYPGLSGGRYLKLSVTDNGSGISGKIIDKIFDPFFTTKKSGDGSGMGLAVVDGIVSKHKGIVNVYSEERMGSTFNVYFPELEGDLPEKEQASVEIQGGSEHIFVIDDEPSLLKSLQETLERLGYTVTATSSGTEGWNKFLQYSGEYDLLITDQSMPDITGLELAKKIKETWRDIPIILISGFNEKINERELKKAGIARFLAKPVDTAKLARSIRSVIEEIQ
jgi:PAS domain S-box-containing protein